MNPQRRRWLAALARAGAAALVPVPVPRAGAALPAPAARDDTAPAADDPVRRGRALVFPRDHGTHLGARTEWWYATGWTGTEADPRFGFQVTFFRSRTGLAIDNPSRFAARHLLFAHAAVTDLAARRHRHDQRIARWDGEAGRATGHASTADAAVAVGDWSMRRGDDGWRSVVPGSGVDIDLHLVPTQPLLLQGDAGYSRKGPEEEQASHYYSVPQLAASARIAVDGGAAAASTGRAWIDHEWSERVLHPQAVGWDWIGINLFDGSALTAFVLRRRDGSALWAGGSFRAPGEPARAFAADAVRFVAGRRWRSPATAASYPVEWRVETPSGRWTVRSLLDAQELDGRQGTGTVYWEGVAELVDGSGRRVGLGYLEMTGYASALKL